MSAFFQLNYQKYFGLYLALILHSIIALALCFNLAPEVASQQIIKINFLSSNSKVSKQNFSTNLSQNSTKKSSENSKNLPSNQAQIEPIYDAFELNNPSPIYPASAKARGIYGKVVLEVLVGANGKALNVKIFSSSGFEILDESALETVANWSFVPAQKFGMNVQAKIFVPIEFKLI